MSGLFTDTVTIYNKISDSEWKRTVVKGVQWSDKTEKKNENGKISIARYASVTFPVLILATFVIIMPTAISSTFGFSSPLTH